MTATAILTSLVRLHPDNEWLYLGGGALLGYIAFSVAVHESSSMHWLSDMASGTLMGYAVGNAVGNGFARRTKIAPTLNVFPILGKSCGISLATLF